jgi:hypothetical protein
VLTSNETRDVIATKNNVKKVVQKDIFSINNNTEEYTSFGGRYSDI